MKIKALCKVIVDLAMTVLMLLSMASVLTGNMVHELSGVSLGILFIIHNILNRRWYQALLKGRYDMLRVLHTAVNLLLLIAMLAAMVSAVTISQSVFAFLNLKGGLLGRQIHTFAANWGFIIMSVHFGLHWNMMIGAVEKHIFSPNRIRTLMLRICAGLIAAYGVYASFVRDIGSKITLHLTYDFIDPRQPAILFFIDYLTIVGLYVIVTYYVLKFLQKRKKQINR